MIVNPVAGRWLTQLLHQHVPGLFARRGYTTGVYPTEGPGDAVRLALRLKDTAGLVVAVGGDGTVNEVAQGLVGSPCPLGIIPAGTANILATELGVPVNPLLAVEAILAGEIKAMDLFKANGRLGAMVASSGLDAGITRWMARQRRGHIGYLSYLEGIWLEIGRYPRHQLELKVDGQSLGTFYEVIITNTRNYGGLFRLKPEACLDDGLLDVCAFAGEGLYRAYKHFAALAAGLHTMLSDVHSARGARIEVTSQTAPYQVDGDFAGTGLLTVEVVPRALRVVVPRESTLEKLTARRKGLWSGGPSEPGGLMQGNPG